MAEIIQKLIEALSTVQFQLPRTANRLPRSSTDETGYPPCKQQIPKPSPQHCSQASIIGGSNFHSMPVVRRDTTETFVPKISASSHRCLLSTKLRRSVLRAWSSSKLKENLQNIHTLDPPTACCAVASAEIGFVWLDPCALFQQKQQQPPPKSFTLSKR